eukprot:2713005-Rhodomonas_salina.1
MEREGEGAAGVGRRRFLSALVEAVTCGTDGRDVLIVVDGLGDADVAELGKTILMFERDVLRDLAHLTGKKCTVKAVVSCLQ